LDSGTKGSENKGMRLKIPFKKIRFFGFIVLILMTLSGVFPFSLVADDRLAKDRAIFWSIHKNGTTAGYLLGTIHSEDPRVLDFSEEFLGRVKENDVFAMELVPDLPTLARLTEYMHYPPGQTLESVIGPARYSALVSALSAYKVPLEFVSRMRPWAAMMTLSTPPPETGFFMDLSLSLRASGNGLKVIGLETLDQQLSFLQEMPMPMQLALLDQAISEFENVNKAHDMMVDAYLENDLVELQALTDEQLEVVGDTAADYFIESGIHARNLRMAETLMTYMDDNRVFVAVGALHLPGEQGLLNLLRSRDYELKPLAMPFSSSR
jgi:uncharacterized protein YbaP (TraB family)